MYALFKSTFWNIKRKKKLKNINQQILIWSLIHILATSSAKGISLFRFLVQFTQGKIFPPQNTFLRNKILFSIDLKPLMIIHFKNSLLFIS